MQQCGSIELLKALSRLIFKPLISMCTKLAKELCKTTSLFKIAKVILVLYKGLSGEL